MAADPTKIEAMVKWPAPKNVKELGGFFGANGVLSKIRCKLRFYCAAPFTQLLKKGNFKWNETTENAFQQLKVSNDVCPDARYS